jgi:hypothetical protein
LVVLSGLASCKKGDKEKAAAPETKVEEPAKTEEPPAPVNTEPVVVDVKLIDATLDGLADATVTSASKEGEAGGLPKLKGELGIACGEDALVGTTLADIGFDVSALKAGKGFAFADVCLGWRPYIEPVTEMYWMISGGVPAKPGDVAPTRRCIRVRKAEAGFEKDAIMDGPCLAMHRIEIPIVDAAEKDSGAKIKKDTKADKKPTAEKKPAPEKKAPTPESK